MKKVGVVTTLLFLIMGCQPWKEADERYAYDRWNEGALDREKELHAHADFIRQELEERETAQKDNQK